MIMNRELDVKIPAVPNYLSIESEVLRAVNTPKIGIEGFTDAELTEIGKAWTEKLIATARRRRNETNNS